MNDLRTLQERLKKLQDKKDHTPNEHNAQHEDTGHGEFVHSGSPLTNTTNTNISSKFIMYFRFIFDWNRY